MFASCANNSDSDDKNPENPTPPLPENVGENPIKDIVNPSVKTITLKHNDYAKLIIKTDGTAEYYDDDELEYLFKYTWDTDKKEIYMAVEKMLYWGIDDEKSQLLSYEQIRSKIDADYTVEKVRQYDKAWYEEAKDRDWFKEDFPDCDTYEKYEQAFLKEYGYSSYSDYVKSWKQDYEMECKAKFGAQVTYAYKNEDGKMTLTEKFTGVKNLVHSNCRYDSYDDNKHYYVSIDDEAHIEIYENGVTFYYYGYVDTDKKTISLEKSKETRSDDGKYKEEFLGYATTATYTEDIKNGTVTINCEDKEYVCKFEGQKFIQE